MMKKLKKSLAVIIMASFIIAMVLTAASFVSAQQTGGQKALQGLEGTANCGYGTVNADGTCDGNTRPDIAKSGVLISGIAGTIVGAALAFIGVLFFILMIYGGFLWMTAQGNDQQIEKAKNLIIAAVIGLIIVMSAYAITAYIGGTLAPSAPAP